MVQKGEKHGEAQGLAMKGHEAMAACRCLEELKVLGAHQVQQGSGPAPEGACLAALDQVEAPML